MLEGEGGDNYRGTEAWEKEQNQSTGESFTLLHVVRSGLFWSVHVSIHIPSSRL